MEVEITAFARLRLNEVYEYYKIRASERIALQITDRLLDAIEELGKLPEIGSIELNLVHLKKNHRYIVCGNYKIIFRHYKNIIYVTDIFDCRQDPAKISKRNK